jgi:hypothetical protein
MLTLFYVGALPFVHPRGRHLLRRLCPPDSPASAAPRPKLVVFLVVDGLPQRQVLDYRDQLAPDGFARFLDRGAWFANAHYGHAFTVTAAGHATMLTGAYPHRTGIIGNDWRDPITAEPVYCTGDTSATYIGHTTNALDGTSPKNLKAETVGDVLRRVDSRSKVIGISGKDRGAILPAGKTGIAYMYMGATGQFASTTHYMAAHPAWVDSYNAAKPADRYFKAEWKAVLPEAAYARSLPDQQPWYGPRAVACRCAVRREGRHGARPALLQLAAARPVCRCHVAGLRARRHLRRAARPGRGSRHPLGQPVRPRLREPRLQRRVAPLARPPAAAGSPAAGLLPGPGRAHRQGQLHRRAHRRPRLHARARIQRQPGPRVGPHQRQPGAGRVNAGLEKRFGEGKWAVGFSGSSVLLNKQLIAQKQADADALAEETRALLMAEPGFAAAYTRRELQSGSRAGAPFFEQMRKSWHPTCRATCSIHSTRLDVRQLRGHARLAPSL